MITAQVLLFVMTVAPAAALESPAIDRGPAFAAALAQGTTSFDAFALADAETSFTQAAAFASSPQERAIAMLWLGAVAAETDDFTSAKARFADAVDVDIAVVVPSHLSPTIVALVEDARSALRVSRTLAREGPPKGPSDVPLAPRPRWALLSGAAVTTLGVLAVGGGAMVGIQAITQRDVASSLVFQSEAVAQYQKAREGALWSNVLYGAGGVMVATGSGLAIASMLGADAL